MSRGLELRRRIQGERPLLLAGVHDGLSARIAARAGFAGLWASGFGISACQCLADVGLISMHEHLVATAAIVAATELPVVADVDDGFGDAINVVRTIRAYEAAGVAGVCLEDNQHPKRNSLYAGFDRRLVACEVFARKIAAACESRRDRELVIIARTEALIAGLGLEEALRRAEAYVDAGADAILIHTKAASAAPVLEFAARWRRHAPLVAVPSTYPSVTEAELFAAGFRVIIFANQGLRAAVQAMDRAFRSIADARSIAAIEETVSPLSEIFAIVDYEEVGRLHARYIEPSVGGAGGLLHRLLIANPDAHPERPALWGAALTLSAGELLDLARGIARALVAAGVRPGDRVVLRLRNSPEFVALFLGVTAAAAIVVPIDHDVGAERLALILKDTGPRLIVVAEGARGAEAGPSVVGFRIDPIGKQGVFTPSLPGAGVDAPLPAVADGADALILYSAGSTGRPKGVVLQHRQLLAIARTLSEVVGMGPAHRDLILSPMTHSGGLQRVWATLLRGGTVVIFEGMLSIPALLDDVERHGITAFFTAPPLLRALLRTEPRRLTRARESLRSIEIASAPVGADELARLGALLPTTDIFLQYGLTECSRALILDARRSPSKLHTVGLPTRGVEVAICGDDGELLPAGREGEILLRAPQRTEHYWNLPDLDASRFRGGWLLTGDYGLVDDDGFVVLRGRRDDMINCGGMSYFPAEVELALGVIDGVKDALVVGVADPQGILTEVPWIFVVPHRPETWSERDFLGLARGRLPAHMIPRVVVVVPAIPVTRTGKPDRREALRLYGPSARGRG